MRIYYLYRHIRPDTNQVFYIGVGVVGEKDQYSTSFSHYYRRAYSKSYRNTYWHNVINKNHKYEIEIILESNNESYILQKETEFIKLYGRKDLGTGTLVNLNDGGLQHLNCSEETKKKISQNTLGVKKTITKKPKLTESEILKRTIRIRFFHNKFLKTYIKKEQPIRNPMKRVKIFQLDTKLQLIKEYKSSYQTGKILNLHRGDLLEVAKFNDQHPNNLKIFHNFIFKTINNEAK